MFADADPVIIINRAIDDLKFGNAHELYGWASSRRGYILIELGEIKKAEEDFRSALAAFKRINHESGEFRSCQCLARCALIQGKFEVAKQYLLCMIDLCA